VFIAPSKGAKKNMDRLVKIKEKILNPGSDMSHDVDFSSMTHYSRSMTNGTHMMKDSMATLSFDNGEGDDADEFENASKNISKEIHYNGSQKMLKNSSQPYIRSKQAESRERFEYYQQKDEHDPRIVESMSTTKLGVNNMVISEHLKTVIEENKKSTQDLHDYVNTHNAMDDMNAADPNKNMINLENILIIEKKIREITDGINTMVDINLLCEDWWEVTQEETMLMNLGNVFKEPKYKAILKRATLCECVTISIVYVISLHLETPPTIILTLLKNMLMYVHQNFLIFVKLILTRLPQESRDNVWAHSLQMLVENKGLKKQKKAELFACLNHNISQLVLITKKICEGRLTLQQLAKVKNMSDSQMMESDQFSINFFFSPLAQTFLILSEEIVYKCDLYTVESAREDLINALEGFNSAMILKREQGDIHDMYKIGGTAFGDNDDLQIVDPPYLPQLTEKEQAKTYTLVLDLDETLAHYFEIGMEGKFLIRPGCQKFLKEMSEYFEIVIFTAAIQDYADWAINQFDPYGYVKYRLYRQHTLPCGSVYIKDLSRLGRDLRRMIIVDNVPENFQLQQDNGIFITSWFDDVTDTALTELGAILKDIGSRKVRDLREELRRFRDMSATPMSDMDDYEDN
jgi:Dullard-like phosphatase family protein